MDAFFKRHFRKKESSSKATPEYCRRRRPSAAVSTSKARRGSNAGLPSAVLMQRRRSSAQVQESPLSMTKTTAKLTGTKGRRRSSTTTPCLNPRFAVRRKRGSSLRTIDTHLLSPSMLLASLIHMANDEGQSRSASVRDCETENDIGVLACGSHTHCSSGSDVDGDLFFSEGSWSETMSSESEEEEEEEAAEREGVIAETKHSQTAQVEALYPALVERIHTRPIIWPPQCLRRNSTHLLPAEFVYGKIQYGLYGNYRKISQRRCSSDVPMSERISKVSRPYFGRYPLQRGPSSSSQASLTARRSSASSVNHIPCQWRKRAECRQENIVHHATWDDMLLYVYLSYSVYLQRLLI
ncbi:uncharacterized protein LOC122811070 [Protopterus annectens]|uniref:uncharacterized protein LOC122811070 n=1 Tax=Protopterus annectens TaxID=7888 RepID=UPI001CFA2BDC|nr:uncharacterized protein LOC122811070 [Protopterus annectens]